MNNLHRAKVKEFCEIVGAVIVGMTLFYAMLHVAAMLECAVGW